MAKLKHVKNIVDKLKYTGINRTLRFFAVLLILTFVLTQLAAMGWIPTSVASLLDTITIVLLAYFVASLFLRLTVNKVAHSIKDLEIEERLLLTKSYTFLIFLIATLFVLYLLGVTVDNITIILGFATTGVAFAVRDIIVSYFAWFMLLTKKPFRIGDHIKIGDDIGQVQHIGTFYVVLDDSPERTTDYVRVPNKVFLEKSITNYGKESFVFPIRMAIKEPKKLKLDNIKNTLKKITGQEINPLLDLDKETVYLTMEVEAKDYLERNKLRHEIIKALVGL